MKSIKILSTISIGLMSAHLFATPVTQSPQMTLTTSVSTSLNVDNFSNVNQQALSPLQANPSALVGKTITDATSLQNLKIYTNSGGGITVTAANTSGSSAALVNSTDNSTIPYAINYIPCGTTTAVNLTTCTGASGCTIPAANATAAACASTTGGTGTYVFGPTTTQVTAGSYTGTTTLTISAGL